MDIDVQVYPHTLALAHAFAETTATALRTALEGEPRATLCVTGGSTPEAGYRLLADADLPWDRIHIFWTDERMVAPDHAQSNYAMAKRTLLDDAGIPASNVHAMDGTLHPKAAAEAYEAELHQFFGEDPVAFDVLHLGMGDDMHTASLFPGEPELDEYERWVVPARAPAGAEIRQRLSLSFLALDTARLAIVLASGEKKRKAFAEVVEAYSTESLAPPPIVRVRPAGELIWMVDQALAGGVS